MTKYVIDDKKLSSEFDEAQIKRFMEELNFSRLEAASANVLQKINPALVVTKHKLIR